MRASVLCLYSIGWGFIGGEVITIFTHPTTTWLFMIPAVVCFVSGIAISSFEIRLVGKRE